MQHFESVWLQLLPRTPQWLRSLRTPRGKAFYSLLQPLVIVDQFRDGTAESVRSVRAEDRLRAAHVIWSQVNHNYVGISCIYNCIDTRILIAVCESCFCELVDCMAWVTLMPRVEAGRCFIRKSAANHRVAAARRIKPAE